MSQQGYVFFLLLVCVCPTKSVPPKKKRGGHFWWNFRLVKIQVFIHPEWYKGRSYLCDVTLYAYKVFQRGEISKLVFFDYHTVKQLRCLISLYPSLVGRICYYTFVLQMHGHLFCKNSRESDHGPIFKNIILYKTTFPTVAVRLQFCL